MVARPGADVRAHDLLLPLRAARCCSSGLPSRSQRGGIGNGIALISLRAALWRSFPASFAVAVELGQMGVLRHATLFVLGVLAVALTALVVTVELARRELPVERDRRTGRRDVSASSSIQPGSCPTDLCALADGFCLWADSVCSGNSSMCSRRRALAALRPGGPLYVGSDFAVHDRLAVVYTAFLWDPERASRKVLTARGLRLTGVAPGEETRGCARSTCVAPCGCGRCYLSCCADRRHADLFRPLSGLPFVLGWICTLFRCRYCAGY